MTARQVTRRRFIGLGVSAATTGLAAAYGGTAIASAATTASGAAMPSTLSIGYQSPYIVVNVLQQRGLLAKQFPGAGTQLSYKLLAPATIQAGVSAGSLSFGIGGLDPTGLAREPWTVVAVTEHSPKTQAILVRPNSGIKTLADLKGKKVSSSSTTIKDSLFLILALRKAGLTVNDVTYVPVAFNALTSSLISGSVDAIQFWDPYNAQLEVAGQAVQLCNGTDVGIQNYVALYGNRSFVSSYPQAVVRTIKAYKQGLDWVKANHRAALELYSKANGLSGKVAELTFSRRDYVIEAPSAGFLQDAKNEARIELQTGVLEKTPDWSTVVNTKLAEEALS